MLINSGSQRVKLSLGYSKEILTLLSYKARCWERGKFSGSNG